MANKIRVFGKAQNRTALGIINAYLKLNPKAKLIDLEREFPSSLNSGLRAYNLTSIFVTPAILKQREGAKIQCCFENDPVKLADGSIIYLFSLWQKVDFIKIVELAPQYDIEVADYKPAEPFSKGGYQLELINGFTLPKETNTSKNKKSGLLWILLAAVLVVFLILFFLLKENKNETLPVAPVVEEVLVVQEEVIEKIKEIQTEFNNIQFKHNKSDLSLKAETVLDDVVSLMANNPQVKINIVGHASAEGEASVNLALSQKRAMVVADYILSKGIEQSRVGHEGKGSSEPLDTNDHALNRRVEFVIIK